MPARRVVLVVDDEAITRDVVGAMLETEDVDVHTAADADSALATARAVTPDVVLLDVTGVDGFEVCRQLTAMEPPPRVVMLTGRADDESRRAAVAAGASGYLLKPYSAVDLFRAIEEEPARGA